MNKMKHILIINLLAIAVISASCEEKKEEAGTLKTFAKVKSGAVLQDTLKHWVELQGNIESPQDVMLTPVMGGNIKRIFVSEGQEVKKGQLIALIDNDALSSQISEAQAALKNAEYNADKQRELFQAGVGTEFNARQAFDQQVLAEQRVKTLSIQAGKAGVYAPFSGIIDEIYPSEGEVGGPQAPICHIVGLDKVYVKANISESYINSIDVGTPVRIIIPALDTVIESQTINRISKYVNPGNRTFPVYIDVDNTNGKLVPNLVARVQINDNSYPNATIVPSSAIQYDKDGNTFLYKLSELDSAYVADRIDLMTLSTYNNRSAVKAENLGNGDVIVMEGAEGIEDKDTVMVLK